MSIDVRDLSFAYGKRQVLRQVSFRTSPGQLVAVLGPNGAGKSTLFRCILGFLPRYRGEIALCGHDLRSLDRRSLARLAAYIPQSSAPVYNYTVRDTVLMGADPFHGPGPSQQEMADRVLETLGIRDLATRGINEISGGERQLALIARAMAQQAKILLMDEPTASLDYGNQFRLLRQVAFGRDFPARRPRSPLPDAKPLCGLRARRRRLRARHLGAGNKASRSLRPRRTAAEVDVAQNP